MKSKIVIEIETLNGEQITTLPEEGQVEEDFEGSEDKKKELRDFRKEYAKDLHNYVVGQITSYMQPEDDRLIEEVMESDYGIEDWEELKDYGIKIKSDVSESHNNQQNKPSEVSGNSSHD